MLKTSDFDFILPEELIAKEPVSPRDEAKMLVCDHQNIIDQKVKNLTNFLNKGDVVVFNDTKVIKAKLYGRKKQSKISINLHRNLGDNIWQVFAKPAKKLKVGDEFIIADDFISKVVRKNQNGLIDLKFDGDQKDFFLKLDKYGQVPIPPYIKRENNYEQNKDELNYQTIYAKNEGAVAAPTAGLHFTNNMLKNLEEKGVKKVFATLNVGAGTFLPVKCDYIKDHPMHSEFFYIDQLACDIINQAKSSGKRVVAIGTTSLRILESNTNESGIINPNRGDTNIFIYPPYKFKMVDILLTNFHLPKSTLFMLISAFIGYKEALRLYNHAINKKYRFYSYGDACLLFGNNPK